MLGRLGKIASATGTRGMGTTVIEAEMGATVVAATTDIAAMATTAANIIVMIVAMIGVSDRTTAETEAFGAAVRVAMIATLGGIIISPGMAGGVEQA